MPAFGVLLLGALLVLAAIWSFAWKRTRPREDLAALSVQEREEIREKFERKYVRRRLARSVQVRAEPQSNEPYLLVGVFHLGDSMPETFAGLPVLVFRDSTPIPGHRTPRG